jgi:hypothetical protein
MKGKNYYASENIAIGAELTVPVLCACPSTKQTAIGVVLSQQGHLLLSSAGRCALGCVFLFCLCERIICSHGRNKKVDSVLIRQHLRNR